MMPVSAMSSHASLAAFEQAATGAALVTFDLFDTLLLRTFRRPADLFKAMASSLQDEAPTLAATFAEDRVAGEAAARVAAASKGRRDVTLAEIYAALPARSFAALERSSITIAALAQREIDLELSVAVPDAEVLAVFDRIVASGVRVVIVSDMYLPLEAVRAMIARIGLAGHHGVHLSCEQGTCKADGSAWAALRLEHGLSDLDPIVHLGDHPNSDGSTARSHGIEAFLLDPPHARGHDHRLVRQDHWFVGACEALMVRELRQVRVDADQERYWLRIAYMVVLPIAVGLCTFITEQAGDLDDARIFFLARDGLIFRRVYEAAFGHLHRIPSAYLWASRRCFNMANIEALDHVALDFLVSGVQRLSPPEYLRRIDLDPDQPEIAREIATRFPDRDRVVDDAGLVAMRSLFLAIEPFVLRRAALEREALLVHLNDHGLFEGRATVVDLGWHGSLQRSLVRLGRSATGHPVDISGVYLGTMADSPEEVDGQPIRLAGWLFAQGEPTDVMAATVHQSVEVIELLFSAPRPGVQYIRLQHGRPRPVRTREKEELHRLRIARSIHEAVEPAVVALRPLIGLLDANDYRAIAVQQLKTLLCEPDREDVVRFRAIDHAEGFGRSIYRPIIAPEPRSLDPRALIEAQERSFWPIAFKTGLARHKRWIMSAILFWRETKGRVARKAVARR